jgi:hypothetical protein
MSDEIRKNLQHHSEEDIQKIVRSKDPPIIKEYHQFLLKIHSEHSKNIKKGESNYESASEALKTDIATLHSAVKETILDASNLLRKHQIVEET